MPVAERRFHAMGGEVHVVVVGGGADLLDLAEFAITDLEARWSRFLPDSEVSRLNAAGGRDVVVSLPTYELVERAVAGWWATGGRFDPTVLPAVVAAGYDRSFEKLSGGGAAHVNGGGAELGAPVPGCGGIRLDPAGPSVCLPVGVAFDPGGIGKGLATDRVVAALLDAGADGACVNLGGDLRVAGRSPSGGAWSVGVEHPEDPRRELTRLALVDGAVATSSTMMRRWESAGGPRHHLIDPRTGTCCRSTVSAATVITGEAWWAEVLAKALFIAGPEAGGTLLARSVACGLVVLDDGAVIELPGLERFVA